MLEINLIQIYHGNTLKYLNSIHETLEALARFVLVIVLGFGGMALILGCGIPGYLVIFQIVAYFMHKEPFIHSFQEFAIYVGLGIASIYLGMAMIKTASLIKIDKENNKSKPLS